MKHTVCQIYHAATGIIIANSIEPRPIIRITPDEIHVNDVGFLDTIYAPPSSRRDKYAHNLKQLRVPGSVGATVSFDVHKKRREALVLFFSKRDVLYLEPMITAKVQQLCDIVSSHAVDKSPLNLSDVLFAFSNEYDLDASRNSKLTYKSQYG